MVLTEQILRDDFVSFEQAICRFYPEDFPGLKSLVCFSVQKYIWIQMISAFKNEHCDQLMRVCIEKLSFRDMPFMRAKQVWTKQCRH
jgi:hypothetical protein